MKTVLLCGAGVLALYASALAETPVEYAVSFDNAAHHEARITASFSELGDAPLNLRMSRASPGRYALHEFAKNVYAASAVDGAGRPLAVERTDPYSWRVAGHDGTVRVTYTLFADRADGTYSQIDRTHAHLNMPATFMWAEGLEDRPVAVSFTVPDKSWKAATQLVPARGRLSFTAPNLQYFMDSPTELSPFDLREWKIADGQTIRLAVHHAGTREDVDRFAEMAKNVVDEQIAIYGEAPAFDHGVYTFIADYLPHASGDGMEHRNSTIISRSDGLYESDFAHLGTLSHEFFHAWNVERIRPAELEPFDFYAANPTPSLWFAEGFTNYYGKLALVRSGEWDLDKYLDSVVGALNFVLPAPGRAYGSPQSMSLEAAFVDAATAIDPNNRGNVFVSYYPYGEVVALALDLTLRQRFENVTLDDYMRLMWARHGKTEKPYTHEDLKSALAEVAGDADFAEAFFASYIEDGALPDYAPLFAEAGLELAPADPDKATLGPVSFEEKDGGLVLTAETRIGSPLYEAGLGRGDRIVSVGRFKTDSEGDWEKALKRHEPGERATVEYVSRGEARSAEVAFAADGALKLKSADTDELTEAQKAFRKSWLKVSAE